MMTIPPSSPTRRRRRDVTDIIGNVGGDKEKGLEISKTVFRVFAPRRPSRAEGLGP